ncbi:MAG TPA: TonB family protein [Caulobacteraceae bacterium]|jgi:TonB family protein|nr:TonB family protein [Caulobacteraceae bacterium]
MRKPLAALSLLALIGPLIGGRAAHAATPVPVPAPKPAAAPQEDPSVAFYPAAARAAGIEGQAVVRCQRSIHVALTGCTLVSETPAGHGFGAAALAMAARSQENPKLDEPGEAARPAQDYTVRFGLHPPLIDPDLTGMAHMVEQPKIVTQPTFAQLQAAYPTRALANQVSGAAAMDCVVTAAGKLTGCRIAAELPTGYGFGQAALDVAPDFALKPRLIDGDPSAGAVVRLAVRFAPGDPAAPLTLPGK